MTPGPAMFSLAGKRALVTGASRGLGRAMAEALGGAGAAVVCAGARKGNAAETAKAVRALGAEAWDVAADLADRERVLAMAEEAERLAGPIDILVNNAGTIRRAPAAEHSLADFELVLRTNLESTFVLSQHIGRGMIARRAGKIVNIASLLSFSGGINVVGYTASKHAVAGVTKALANEWAPFGVQVNAIAPGYFRTELTEPLTSDPEFDAWVRRRVPAGRWGDPEELGGAAVFLASSASDFVNGQIIYVDGGMSAVV